MHRLRDLLDLRRFLGLGDLLRLQRLLGHKSQAMVRRYAHLRPRDLREAVELVSFEVEE